MWLVQWAKSRSKRNVFGIPVPNFGRVTDVLYRGALPDAEGYRALAERMGVRRVLSIIEHERAEDARAALSAGVAEWHHVAFSDRHAPDSESVRRWLEYVRSAERDGAVFTHCRGGRHRTGVLVAVFRTADQGWTKEQAYNEMLLYGWYSANGHKPLLDWFFHTYDPAEFRK